MTDYAVTIVWNVDAETAPEGPEGTATAVSRGQLASRPTWTPTARYGPMSAPMGRRSAAWNREVSHWRSPLSPSRRVGRILRSPR